VSAGRRLGAADASALERCLACGGVAVFRADTVYGLACDPGSEHGARRLYELKGRPARKPSAVMLFDLDRALAAADPGPRTFSALRRLLPGPLTVLLANPGGLWPLACAGAPETLGLRVPALDPPIEALAAVRAPLMQSSANLAGGPDAATAAAVPASIRSGADLVLDAGPAPGMPSTVVDLRGYEGSGEWSVIREGAVGEEEIGAALE